MLDNANIVLALAALSALGEIGRNGCLTLTSETKFKNGSSASKETIIEQLIKKVQSSKENNKVRRLIIV